MILRKWIQADCPQLWAIEQATQVIPWTLAIFQQCWKVGYLGWVVETNQITQGFVFMSLSAGECHILNLAVHPEYQRQGLGEKLMDHALMIAKEQGALTAYLEVRRSNKAAINLYRKMNFKQISERKNYYPTPKGKEDALIFAIDLGLDDLFGEKDTHS